MGTRRYASPSRCCPWQATVYCDLRLARVTNLRGRFKKLLFGALGKDPEAVVVTFLSGDPDRAQKMFDEVRRLEPARRHYAISAPGATVENSIPYHSARQLRRAFRRLRIGLAPVLFDG